MSLSHNLQGERKTLQVRPDKDTSLKVGGSLEAVFLGEGIDDSGRQRGEIKTRGGSLLYDLHCFR